MENLINFSKRKREKSAKGTVNASTRHFVASTREKQKNLIIMRMKSLTRELKKEHGVENV